MPHADDPSTELRNDAGEAGAELEPLARGAIVGRYVVVDVLGAGAMGVVYAAYDPELMRQVALKVLRTREDLESASARLRREAQALAKLSHRNVVAVYDVGQDAGRVYLAMELVRGSNLRGWLAARPRPWSEALPVMLAAGHGLAAAHAHGLVHRDFKPENVIIAARGDNEEQARVCVTDFGLARGSPSGAAARSSGALAMTLTVEGDTVGTPAYMAPEQHKGGIADARSDQYAFCVALYEALYGERPFGGDHAEALSEAKHKGPIRPAERSRIGDPSGHTWPVPAWLRAIVRRGLAVDPADRFPSMDALLAALSRESTIRRRRTFAAVGVVLGLGAIAFLVALDREGPCAEAGTLPAGWDDDTRAAIASSFAQSGKAYATPLASWVIASLDDAANGWSTVHRQLCEATWSRGEQSPELLDVRMACMRRTWNELAAAATVLADADGVVVEHAPELVGDLARADACAELQGVRTDSAASEPLERELADTRALRLAGRERVATDRTDDLLVRARELGEPRVLGQTLLLRAQLADELGDSTSARRLLAEALASAKPARDTRLEAQIWTVLAQVVGYTDHDYDEGRFYGELALAAIDALGRDDVLRSWADTSLGAIAFVAGDDQTARRHWESALALRRAVLGEDHYLTASSLNNLGGVLYGLREYDEAAELLGDAMARREQMFGAEHPSVAESAINLGLVRVAQHRSDDAIAVIERALAIQSEALGPDHPNVGRAHDALCGALEQAGRHAEAIDHALEAEAIYRASYGPTHPALAPVTLHHARALTGLDRRAEARALLEPWMDGATPLHAELRAEIADALAAAR
jgi:tRNA A-37 threonylcarbamoyl transferase component Bud32/tetratricopeptide (TPR) repeat protein